MNERKYLFFDIECANNYQSKGKICEFGYVLTNEKFEVLQKDVFVMSPGKYEKFDKSIFERDKTFKFAYDFDYYYKSPLFPHFYQWIKNLMTQKNLMIFGFAVNNDVLHLFHEMKRYNLELFDYVCYDIQRFTEHYKKINNLTFHGLGGAFEYFDERKEGVLLNHHLSRDDAFMTMRVFEYLLKKLNLSVDEIIEKMPSCKINSLEYALENEKKVERRFLHNKLKNEWNNYCKQDINFDNKIALAISIRKHYDLLNDMMDWIIKNNYYGTNDYETAAKIVVASDTDKNFFKEKYPLLAEKCITYHEIKNKKIKF